jgi:hypothetical protein
MSDEKATVGDHDVFAREPAPEKPELDLTIPPTLRAPTQ